MALMEKVAGELPIRTFPAERMLIEGARDERYWGWVEKEGSKSAKVAFLKKISVLDVSAEVETQLPAGTYILSWVLQFTEGDYGWYYPVTLSATYGEVSKSESAYFPLTRETASREVDNGWLEFDALQFTIRRDQQTVELMFSLEETSSSSKSGMFIDGVIIRPSSMLSKPDLL